MSKILAIGRGRGGKIVVPVEGKRIFSIPLGATFKIGDVMFKVTYIRADGLSMKPVDSDVVLKEL